MNEELKKYNEIAEEETYFCFWKHYEDTATTFETYELLDQITEFSLKVLCSELHGNVYYYESSDINECLIKASKSGRKYALIATPGFMCKSFLIKYLIKLAEENQDTSLFCHIMDESANSRKHLKRQWYGIHPQILIVNLEIYKKLGTPNFTNFNNESKLIKPERSVQNIHDDYTPVHLKPSKEYTDINDNLKLPFGWYYINKSLENGYKILNFDNFIRQNKDYFYLEDIDSGFETFQPNRKKQLISKIKKYKFMMDIGFSNKIYAMNTEPYPDQMNLPDSKNPFKMYDSFDNYIFLSAGFVSNYFLNQFKYNGKQKVIFYDVSGIGLSFKRILNLKWNPSDSLYQFIKDQGLEKNDPEDYVIDFTDEMNDIDSEWFEELDRWSGGLKEFKEHWKIFREQNHDYWFWDILNNPTSNYCDIINNLPGKTFMWVSNVFSNEKALYDKQNYTNINQQIKTLLKNLSTNTVVHGYLPDINEETNQHIFKSFSRKTLQGQKKVETFIRENKNIPKDNFCVLPFMHMTSSVAGWYRVCCSSSYNLKNMSQSDTSIEDAFRSDEMNDIRSQFIKGERPTACNNCWKKEDKNIESMRISMNNKFKDIIPQLDYKKPTIKYLDIKYDNKCNLACRMCSFGSSDQHQKEMIIAVEDDERLPNHMDYAINPKVSNYKRQMLKRLNKKNDKPFLEDDVIKALPHLEMLKVTGGEPTVNHKFLNAIDYAIEHDYAKNIKLDITTNGTKFNKTFLEKISHFKYIRFRISVDGTGKVYDYIRYPFTWNMFDRSINFMFNYFKKKNILHDKVSVGFSCIAQPYNIFDLGNLYNWGYALFKKYYNIPIKEMIDINVDFQMIPNQSELNIEFMDHEILKNALNQFELQTKNIEKIRPRLEYFKNFVNNLSDNTNILDLKKYQLRKTTLFYDKIRSQSYKECLNKEIVEYIDNVPLAPWEKENNGFCILPWIHLSTRTDGTMQLCCTANSGSTKDRPKIGCNRKEDGSLVNLKEDNWTEYWNTDYMKNVRSEMLKGNKPIECSKCYNEEEVGYNSKRSWENEKWMNKIDYDTVVWNTTNEGHSPIDIHYADLKLGNKCNLACSTCNPDDSSLWIKDWNKLDKSDMTDPLRNMLGDFKKGNFNWYNNKTTWEELYKQNNLKTVYMLGGEPTIINEFKSFIDKAKNINLRFNTNGQVIDDELFDIYKKLDNVEIALSIDGIEKRHEWLRYPSNLDTTIENLKSYNQLTRTNNNIKTNIDTTVSIFNVLHIPELIKWKMNNIDLKDINQYPTHGGMIGIHFLHNPKFLSIKCLPEKYKELVSKKYEEFYEWLKINHDYYDKIIDKPNGIKKLKSIVNFMWSEDMSNLLPQTFEYVQRLENIRQLNFSIIFPELKDLYNEYR